MNAPRMRAVHADGVVPGDGDPIRDGAVVFGPDGLIVDVGRAEDVLPRHAGASVERVQGVVLPGLVNAHTHLELSALRGQVPGGAGFVPWVEHLIGNRIEARPEEDGEAIERAVSELDAFGTIAVGEVTNSLASVRSLARRRIAGCVFHEVFGVDRASVDRRLDDLPRILEERVGAWPTTDLAYAATPHTLYTTHASAVRRLVDRAREQGARISIHLAEHASERRFLESGDGPIVGWYAARLKIERQDLEWPRTSPVAFADALGVLDPRVLLVHLTDARPEELELVARRDAPVVLCPRSNLFIETRLPPLLAARAAGIAPALGTDSLASNASLDVLAEAKALADRFPTVSASALVTMATWSGAQALGRPDLGRFASGARPGVLAVEGAVDGDPAAFVLAHLRLPRRWIVRRGEETPS